MYLMNGDTYQIDVLIKNIKVLYIMNMAGGMYQKEQSTGHTQDLFRLMQTGGM